MATLARKCNSNAGVLTKQIKAKAWGAIELTPGPGNKLKRRLFVPEHQAAVIIDFHQRHAPVETVAGKLGQNKKRVKRVLEGINKLGEKHPMLALIGGKIGVKAVGNFKYIELEHVPRLKRALTEFITLEQANRDSGLGQGALPSLLKKGHWPEVGLVSFGTNQRWVHKSVVPKVKRFLREHHTLARAAQLAKMTAGGFQKWIDDRGYPGVRLPSRINGAMIYVPKSGFRQLVQAFKQGPASAMRAVEEYNRQNTKTSFDNKLASRALGISERNALDAALNVLNKHCTNQAEQDEFLDAVHSFSAEEIDERQATARQEFCKLAQQAGGLKTDSGKILAMLVEHPASLAIKHNWLVLASRRPESERAKMISHFLSGSESLEEIIRRSKQSDSRKGWKGVEDKSAEKPFPKIKVPKKKKGNWNTRNM